MSGEGWDCVRGEIFGLAVDEVDVDAQMVHVVQQVKEVGSRLIFAPPKGGKFRDVPLPDSVATALAEHAKEFPPVEVTLPWGRPDGPEVTRRLYFTTRFGNPLRHQTFEGIWKPALVAAEVIPPPEEPGKFARAPEDGMHALRHHYASVLLDAGENIKALSAYLGHSDPGFTLRVYTHLMPTSESRTRGAVDEAYRKAGRYRDGPETARMA
ncbi:hypothetical protein GCM10009838_19080 [Catenulispora subtropica]|uniref:Tyr recombinase domain-containing protein n=1 Tax=Catenulispora subtropica TaxID=450798 RepID=A0ABN2R2U0_9ACTN